MSCNEQRNCSEQNFDLGVDDGAGIAPDLNRLAVFKLRACRGFLTLPASAVHLNHYSDVSLPSSRRNTRSMRAANSSAWVTTTRLVPDSRFSSSISSNTVAAVW